MCQKMRGIVGLGLLVAGLFPVPAKAQMIAVGPRFSLIRGDLSTNTPTSRFLGGVARLKLSGNLSVEGAMETKTTWNTALTQRIRETPLQASVLIYPIRAAIAPYVVGGFGVYSRTYDVVAAGGVVAQTAEEKKSGVHLGFGGEVSLGRHAVAFLDYRYRFVTFGNDPTALATSDPADPLAKLLKSVPGLGQLNVSHQGAMWTGGVAFVF